MKQRVKIFSSYYESGLEEQINDFLEYVEIRGIQYSTTSIRDGEQQALNGSDLVVFSALIKYQEVEEKAN